MSRAIYTAFLAFLLYGCPTETRQRNETPFPFNGIVYIKDTRPEPDVCFAGMYLGSSANTLATVPCESVEHLIE